MKSACVHLTKSDRVCVSEFCRRCWTVLKEDEGEEWGLSKPWGRRRTREDEGDGMSGAILIRKRTQTISLVSEKDRTVQPTSMSPSLESIERRPAEQRASFTQLIKLLIQ